MYDLYSSMSLVDSLYCSSSDLLNVSWCFNESSLCSFRTTKISLFCSKWSICLSNAGMDRVVSFAIDVLDIMRNEKIYRNLKEWSILVFDIAVCKINRLIRGWKWGVDNFARKIRKIVQRSNYKWICETLTNREYLYKVCRNTKMNNGENNLKKSPGRLLAATRDW